MKAEDVEVGGTYYMTCRHKDKICFKVKVISILNNELVLVQTTNKSKTRRRRHTQYTVPTYVLHSTPDIANCRCNKNRNPHHYRR